MAEQVLQQNIQSLAGVGDKKAAAFARLGIFTQADLLTHYPRGYEDRTKIKKIIELCHDETVCICGVVTENVKTQMPKGKMRLSTVKVSDGTGFIELVWFNNRFIESSIKKGETYIFYGKVRLSPKKQMQTPIFEPADNKKRTGVIYPIYPLTEGLTENFFADCVQKVLSSSRGTLPETLPLSLRKKYALCEINFATENIHFPIGKKEYELARRRLAFEELFFFQSALFSIKERQQNKQAPLIDYGPEEFIQSLPFTLTRAQRRVIEEIRQDLAGGTLMNRLVCGDVGSGKTAVAAAAIYMTAKKGFQSAFMAPTEILAQQHYKSLTNFFKGTDIVVTLLSGSLTKKERKDALEKIKFGVSTVVVGTHALVGDEVIFQNLGLAITDEQHRFGVTQRKLLSDKGQNTHVLVMSATPIPRTLALIIYGDLDISIIDERPPGRQAIDTFPVTEGYRDRVYTFLQKEIKEGKQAYIVCPLVEDSGDTEMASVLSYKERLTDFGFAPDKIGVLHGKMKNSEKETVMAAFKQGTLSILVATSVIEVGIDVPNASVILIENAERFGLSQLHQLRGRVGRGKAKSYCILLAQSGGETAMNRLQVMKKEQDGFKIAEADLKQRGPGEFFGTRQHGLPAFKVADLYTDMALLKETTEAARQYLAGNLTCTPQENDILLQKINHFFDNHVTNG